MKQFLECGRIVSTHGVRGEVKAEVWMDSPQEMTALKTLYLEGGKTPLPVQGARVQKNMVLLKLAGVETPEAGSLLRQKVLYARREDIPLKKGQYFLQDLIGLAVVDADSGRRYGTLTEITETGANRVYTSASPTARCGWRPISRRWSSGSPRKKGLWRSARCRACLTM